MYLKDREHVHSEQKTRSRLCTGGKNRLCTNRGNLKTIIFFTFLQRETLDLDTQFPQFNIVYLMYIF